MTDLPAPHARPDEDLVRSVRSTLLETLAQVLDGATHVALVDFPYHRNAGDAAIWAGERAALDALGVTVSYVADAGRYDPRRLREALPEGPVLLHGGGSVGDLWPWPQALREQLLGDLPDRHVVQLPQSVHFDDQDLREQFARVVAGHGRYTFMARDEASADRATALRPDAVVLAPDMAFGLGPLTRTRPASVDVLALARDDMEGVSGLREGAVGRALVVDWSLGRVGDLRWQAVRMVPRLARPLQRDARTATLVAPMTAAALEAMCRQVLGQGVGLLSTARVVVTDRLHAHLLCCLLGIPHVVLDNSYGKISALHRLWTSSSETTHWAEDPDQALDLARTLLG
ncbi:polysaccharide pyruvyl transferase family protein [Jannaschia sp. R86511]|uniref:polysaccharide pyruvyl transferase family protein n=1 Tax=Jannaschia sp. R86511 TaxID=3093853 RepID=UPI0036D27F71